MDAFFNSLAQYPLLLSILVLGVLGISFFAVAKGRRLKLWHLSVDGSQPQTETSVANELSVADIREELISASSPIDKIPNAVFKQDKIHLRLGRVSTLFGSERHWLVLKDLDRKPRKDIYSYAKDVDFALIEFRGIVHARGSAGTYEEENGSHWLPVIEGDGVEDCCVSSFSHWTKDCAFFWVEHIDTHNREAIVNVMWFEKK